MTKTQIEVITSVQRRRRWSTAEKERIVAAAIEPGAVASEVARMAGIHVSQLFRWRRQLCGPCATGARFSAVAVVPGPMAASACGLLTTSGTIEIEFASGTRMRIFGTWRSCDDPGDGHGAGQSRTAAMIPIPSGVRVWLAKKFGKRRDRVGDLARLGWRQMIEPHRLLFAAVDVGQPEAVCVADA